jgi:hypothetical protein
MDQEFELRIGLERSDVFVGSRREIVQGDDVVAVGEQPFTQKATDEAGSARNQIPHPHLLP